MEIVDILSACRLKDLTAKEVLHELDLWFTGFGNLAPDGEHTEGDKLAQIFKALRGPDDDDVVRKGHTTQHIRSWAFPITKATCWRELGPFGYWDTGAALVLDNPSSSIIHDHFMLHSYYAARYLFNMGLSPVGMVTPWGAK